MAFHVFSCMCAIHLLWEGKVLLEGKEVLEGRGVCAPMLEGRAMQGVLFPRWGILQLAAEASSLMIRSLFSLRTRSRFQLVPPDEMCGCGCR